MADIEKMQKYLKRALGENYNIISEKQKKQFNDYFAVLEQTSKRMNLTTILDEKGVAEKHFADSVFPVFEDLFEKGDRVIDIGSGAGLPGLPIKIIRPDFEMTLLEATGKKAEFIKSAARECGLEVCVISNRAEEAAREKEHREKYDVCVSRAVARLNILLELCVGFVKKGGYILAYKGEKAGEEKREAEKAAKELGLEFVGKHMKDNVEDQHCILVYKKEKSLPGKYPRRFSNIKKNPL